MRSSTLRIVVFAAIVVALAGTATAQDKPNILVIWGDDMVFRQ